MRIQLNWIFNFLIMLIIPHLGHAQQKVSIEGRIFSGETGKPVEDATILISGTNRNAVTNAEGYYKFNELSSGTYTLAVNSLGYFPQKKKVEIEGQKTLIINFELATKLTNLDEVLLTGRGASLIGISSAASEGSVSQVQLEKRPILRTGEVLESVPSLIVSQHSGSGKANQYYLRGLNLDHGTDFATSLQGMPLNLPTNGHGQGYLDVNFLIPELIKQIDFQKGPYYADVGDFASAGKSNIELTDKLENGILKTEAGFYNYYRGLFANSSSFGDKNLLYGIEYNYSKGPWDNPENANKFSGILKFSGGNDSDGYSLTALGYYNKWNATDQIPLRAVDQNLISRFGSIDESDGGKTGRYSILANWWNTHENGSKTIIIGYASYYRLNLFSNFSYYLENPERGDQFEQVDRRLYGGATVSHIWSPEWFGKKNTNEIGAQFRHDQIFEVGLYNTEQRQRYNTVRNDRVAESSGGVYFSNTTQWFNKLKTTLGVRGDLYLFKVNSNIAVNSGNQTDFIASPKFRLVLGPWVDTEFYVDLGLGYHSNDARGTTIQIDPSSRESVDTVDPLVRTRGAEIGIRNTAINGLQSTLSFWYLGLDSELVFIGDAGGTEASDSSNHFGIEWANFYKPLNWLALDLDLSLNRSRFTDVPKALNRIPNSISTTIKSGITTNITRNWYASLRMRYFGPQPLTESGEIESEATHIMNFRTAYQWNKIKLALDVLNILDSKDPDISYYYTSRLRDEPSQGIDDIHFHPVLPVTARLSVTFEF